jgi:hypothetical protein
MVQGGQSYWAFPFNKASLLKSYYERQENILSCIYISGLSSVREDYNTTEVNVVRILVILIAKFWLLGQGKWQSCVGGGFLEEKEV